MTRPAPPIDPRSHLDLVADTERLAEAFSPWRRSAPDGDFGRALIAVFAGMAEQVLDRLNAVPERDFLAFLELLGVEPLPARAARVPLTFSPPAGSAGAGFVPAGTPVSSPPGQGPSPVRFFTDRDLMVVPGALAAAVVSEPAADRRADATAGATGAIPDAWPAFTGDSLVEHALYLAHDGFATLPRPRTLGVTIDTPDAFGALPLEWDRWDGSAWRPVPPGGPPASTGTAWSVSLGDVEQPEPVEVAGRSARWLRARLRQAIGTVPEAARVAVAGVTVTAELDAPPAAPTAAFSGAVRVDLTGDVHPFGEQPRFTDSFTIGSDVFGRAGAAATVDVTISAGLASRPAASGDLVLVWEVGGADGWVQVGRSGPGAGPSADVDGTAGLTRDGQVRFPVPPTGGPLLLNGVLGWWLRVRIAGGDYGRPASYRPSSDPQRAPELVPASFAPPAVSGLQVSWRFSGREPAQGVVTVNGDETTDRTGATAPYPPFRPPSEDRPALHLGFDRPFPNRPVLLHVQVEPAPYDPDRAAPDAVPLTWEYAGPTGWSGLGAVDETHGLTRSGPVGFIGPTDLVPTPLSGRTLCWLRVRPAVPGPAASPRLRRVLLNTVPATAAVPAADEVLGAGDASAGQQFRTTRTPVLAGERVEVMTAGEWHPWQRVPDFLASGPLDRHYVLDRDRGEVVFGDGRRGGVPPAGSAVRATYRSGGGSTGNRPAGSLTQLEVALAGVDRVVNPEPATGGADAEPVERVRVRGPVALRHGGRAVAAEDYRDLAAAASPDVARALAVPSPVNPLDVAWIQPVPVDAAAAGAAPTDGSVLCTASPDDVATHRPPSAGRVAVAVVPESGEARPAPSQQLLDDVGDELRLRCPAVLGSSGLAVVGPEWVEVIVQVTVAATGLTAAQGLADAVTAALERFLHPLHGGPDGGGWQFGRVPHPSDLIAVVSAVPGADHVVRLALGENPSRSGLALEALARTLVWSGQHTVTVVPAGGAA